MRTRKELKSMDKASKIRIKDIAFNAGTSVGTVDHVLHNSGKVKQETRDKIMSFVTELNYKPNLLAKSIASKKNNPYCCFYSGRKQQQSLLVQTPALAPILQSVLTMIPPLARFCKPCLSCTPIPLMDLIPTDIESIYPTASADFAIGAYYDPRPSTQQKCFSKQII